MTIIMYYYSKMPDYLDIDTLYGTLTENYVEDIYLNRLKSKQKIINVPSILFIDLNGKIRYDKINKWMDHSFPRFTIIHYDVID